MLQTLVNRRGARGRRTVIVSAVAALALATTSLAGEPRRPASADSSTLEFAMVNPFTGNDGVFGQSLAAGCIPAVKLINAAGGVLGHQLRCITVDTKGDPADAVPAVTQVLATHGSNLVGVLGPSGDEATATVPLLTRAKLPMFAATGQALYDHNTNPYFWRITPADDAGGVALAVWAVHQHYRRGAAFFGNDVGAQASVPALLKAYAHLGGKMVSNVSVALNATSYGTEIERLITAKPKPQVIFTEASPQTSATAFRNLVQLNGMMPIFGTNATATPDWLKAVSNAIGVANMTKYYVGVEPYAPTGGSAWKAYDQALLSSGKDVPDPKQWADQEYSMWPYDAATIMALAMLKAHSANPATYNGAIRSITAGSPGAVVVHTFAQGKSALAAGKSIRFVGATGLIAFDRWQNSQGAFEAVRYLSNGSLKYIATISAAQLSKAHG